MPLPYAVRRAADCVALSIESINNRLRYSTFVNVERRYLYFEVPKAGCTSIKWLLHSVEHMPPIEHFSGLGREVRRDMFIHERRNLKLPSLLDLDDGTQEFVLTSPEFMRFAVVRNPYTRVQSAWKDKVRLCAPRFESYSLAIKGRLPIGNDAGSIVSFHEFVDALAHEDLARSDPHWRLQSEHTLRGAMNFTHIGRLEDLSSLLRIFLAHIGEAERPALSEMNQRAGSSEYDQELATRVYELYRQDFEQFEYGPESWPRPPADAGQPRFVPETEFVDEVIERNIVISHLYSERANLRERVRQLEEQKREPSLEACRTTSFDELFDLYISRIDGWLPKEEAAYLYRLAKEATVGCIVAVGSYRGRSTAALAFGVNAGAGLPVYAVEPHEPFRGVFGGEFGPKDRGDFMRTMVETGLYHHVRLVNVSSEYLADKWPMPVSVLFIDGDHRYEAVERDFESLRGKLAPNALVVFDDAANPSNGPGQLSREIVNSGAFTVEPAIGKLVCLRRRLAAVDERAKKSPPASIHDEPVHLGDRTLPAAKRVGIIVPYRNRETHLCKFIPHLISYFQRDRAGKCLDAKIIIVEQIDDLPFNRGGLLNAGFLAIADMVDYVCFHDVDYLPMWADYTYPETPTRIIWWGMHSRPIRVNDLARRTAAPRTGLGAVTLFANEQFRRVNGYSNRFFGWGFEDKDLAARCRLHSLTIAQRDGTFIPLDHDNAGFLDDGSKSPIWLKNEQRYAENQREYESHGTSRDGLSTFAAHMSAVERVPTAGLDDGEKADVMHLLVNFGESQGVRRASAAVDLLKKVPIISSHSDASIQFARASSKIGRNDPCPCGSGKKFKKCCGKAA